MNFSIVINTRNRKKLLYELIDSLLKCNGREKFEYIVVDDCSDEDYTHETNYRYPFITFLRNISRQYLIRSRNMGWSLARNEWVFFIDDDNEIKDPDFFIKAKQIINANPKAGIMGARSYYFDYPDTIMVGPTRFNKATGKTSFLGLNQIDKGQLNGILETHDVPNAFFVSRTILQKTGGFTEEIVQTFSEADFAEKVRKLGLRVYQSSELKVYHKSDPPNFKHLHKRQMGGTPERFYFLMRNRFVFIKEWGNWLQKIMFTLVFSHLYTFYYLLALVRTKEYKMIKSGIIGIWHGYLYMFTGRLFNLYGLKN